MLQSTVAVSDPYTAPASQNPAVLSGAFNGGQPVTNDNVLDRTPYAFLWCATARGFTGDVSSTSVRNGMTPFMVGLREDIEIQVNNGTPWQWRRICFRSRRNFATVLGTSNPDPFYTPTSAGGARRTVTTLTGNRNAGQQYALYELLFQGANASDWVDPMTAKVDTSRLTIVYDQVKKLASGNESGMIRSYRRWHRMNKTLVYNGDEAATSLLSGDFSTQDPPGMGDYYVVDLFRARYGATSSSVLTFSPNATLYFHEK